MRPASGSTNDEAPLGGGTLEAFGPTGGAQHALAAELRALTEAPPDVQTGCGAMVTMKLAATELDAQKQEIAALNKKFGEVKREVKEHLDMLGELFEEVVEGAEDASFFPEEREALMILQGAMLEILDTLSSTRRTRTGGSGGSRARQA
jgi:hypothetical protein